MNLPSGASRDVRRLINTKANAIARELGLGRVRSWLLDAIHAAGLQLRGEDSAAIAVLLCEMEAGDFEFDLQHGAGKPAR